MKYALVEGERQEAQPGRSGQCLCCKRPVVAKCGAVRIWHWAHRGRLECDHWWEIETEWHRAWKGHFPKEWQEVVHYAENGEKHIADVKIDQGYVIEFQHSHINAEERQAREGFYKKMVWVVDGTRRSRDKNKFIEILGNSRPICNKEELRRLDPFFDECALIRDWKDSATPVFFDFDEDKLWCLLPKAKKPSHFLSGFRYMFAIERKVLVSFLFPTSQVNSFKELLNAWGNLIVNDEGRIILKSMNQAQHREASHLQRQRGRPRL